MSDIDQLIDELFPKGDTDILPVSKIHSVTHEAPASQADWDASDKDDDNDNSNINHNTISCKPKPRRLQVVVDSKNECAPETSKSYFDDSDKGESEADMVSISHSLTVSFPFLPSDVGGACVGKCYVTNVGAKGLHHPTIPRMLLLSERKYSDRLTQKQLLEIKGAFHAIDPRLGNGALDKYSEEIASVGGCPLMLCRKCNYGVIRLQGVAWQDGGGTIDMYLTLRNYFPDWGRLVAAYPVGQTKNAEGKVLKADAGCAAYCCQCSWLTVKSPQEIIETRLADPLAYATREDSLCFATELPLLKGEKRRPPLWVCRGHVPHF